MKKAEHKGFGQPDEVREFALGHLELLGMDKTFIGRGVFEPGWRWSESVKPIVHTDSCEAPHFQYHVSGTMHVVMDDGAEFDVNAGEVASIPPGHDAWVVGSEPVVVIDFQGMRDFAKATPRRMKQSA